MLASDLGDPGPHLEDPEPHFGVLEPHFMYPGPCFGIQDPYFGCAGTPAWESKTKNDGYPPHK